MNQLITRINLLFLSIKLDMDEKVSAFWEKPYVRQEGARWKNNGGTVRVHISRQSEGFC